MNEQLIKALNTRYATKKFDASKKLDSAQVDTILEAVRLTPTSYGLQLMKIVVVEDPAVREKLVAHSFGQKQVSEASHLLILCREKEVDESHISNYISTISSTRNIPLENLHGFQEMMKKSILPMAEDTRNVWMEKQVYIALGNLLTACAILNVDACPMEGFSKKDYDEVLQLHDKNLSSIVIIPIGFRANDDTNAAIKKVRRAPHDFIVRI